MNSESGACYIVLFSNGFIKGGKSRDVIKRYKTHKSTALALGISVEKAFYTEYHSDYHASEKQLLSALANVSEDRVGEFFRGATEDSALEALCALGFEISMIGESIFGLSKEAFLKLAEDRLTGEVSRVLHYLLSKVDFENHINVAQTEIAANLGLQKTNVSRAVKLLCDKGIILKGPKVGRFATYRLNADYGWKGKVRNLEAEQPKRFKAARNAKTADQNLPTPNSE